MFAAARQSPPAINVAERVCFRFGQFCTAITGSTGNQQNPLSEFLGIVVALPLFHADERYWGSRWGGGENALLLNPTMHRSIPRSDGTEVAGDKNARR